jgi:hypothetical protein
MGAGNIRIVALRAPALRPATTLAVTRGAGRLLRAAGYAVICEMPLATGRRLDIMALSPSGDLLAIEVKSGREDFAVDRKWPEYRDWCDAFAFAVAPDFPMELLPEEAGLLVADAWGGEWLRQAPRHPLAPARRKAVTIAFARLAAIRLQSLDDPALT